MKIDANENPTNISPEICIAVALQISEFVGLKWFILIVDCVEAFTMHLHTYCFHSIWCSAAVYRLKLKAHIIEQQYVFSRAQSIDISKTFSII